MADKNVRRKMMGYEARVDGNVARSLNAYPNELEPQKEQQQKQSQGKPEKPIPRTLSLRYCIFLTAASAAALLIGAYYLEQQAVATSLQKNIVQMEGKVTQKRKDNEDELNRINRTIDSEEIRKYAEEVLGMKPAGEDNVIYYPSANQNYVDQYEEVPQE